MLRERIHRAVAGAAGAVVLMATFAGSAAAADVSNESGVALVAQTAWGEVDVETGAGEWGLVAAFVQDGERMMFLYEQSAVSTTCDAGTPDDVSDDYSGLQGTFRTATGPAEVDIAANLRRAAASATLNIETVVFDECTQQHDVVALALAVPISLELTAEGARESWIDRFHDGLPGVFNEVGTFRSASQPATGTLSIGEDTSSVADGLISRNRWNNHFSGRFAPELAVAARGL